MAEGGGQVLIEAYQQRFQQEEMNTGQCEKKYMDNNINPGFPIEGSARLGEQ